MRERADERNKQEWPGLALRHLLAFGFAPYFADARARPNGQLDLPAPGPLPFPNAAERLSELQSMPKKSSVIFEATNLRTGTEVASAVAALRRIFDGHGLLQPPLPQNMLKLAPCSLVVTEIRTSSKSRHARIVITDADGKVVYDHQADLA